MTKEAETDSNFFGTNWIDLSSEANAESQAFTSQLFWENLAFKVITKLRILVNQSFNNAIKRRIENKIDYQKPLSPYDLLMYRSHYYEQTARSNYKKIIGSVEQEFNLQQANHKKYESNLQFPKLFLNKLFKLKRQGKLSLIYSKNILEKDLKDDGSYIFFDSYFFFNGGHLAALEQSIDNIQSANNNIKFVFLLDRKMILFPSLSKAILDKCNKMLALNVSKFPINFDENSLKNYTVSNLIKGRHLIINKSRIQRDCIFNPIISWTDYPYRFNGFPQKAWRTAFTSDESLEIINKLLSRMHREPIKKNYVVIHTRNSTLMSDQIRNTKSLKDRAALVKGILEMGLQVIVLGVMNPSSKFKHSDVIYADELGGITDDLQIHMLNSAVGVIGSPSGITHLTYCTDTPLLLLDVPFPFCSYYPASNMKALLKKPRSNGKNVPLATYYEYNQYAYLKEAVDLSSAFSEMRQNMIELECNSDDAILHAFKELLIETYGSSKLKNIKINQTNDCIDIEVMERDKHEISYALRTCKKNSDKYSYFEVSDLSTANWFVNH